MRSLLLVPALALTLAACGKKEEAAPATVDPAATTAAAPAADAPVAMASATPGTYEAVDASGAVVQTTTVMKDGAYTIDAPGKRREAGVVRAQDGKLCFDPSGDAAAVCYAMTAPAADGSFKSMGPDGATMTMRPKAM